MRETPSVFVDNKVVLDALEDRSHGAFPLLDEELRLPRGTEMNFVSKLVKAQPTADARITQSQAKGRADAQPRFTVKHFAGSVTYTTRGWLEQSRDEVPSTVRVLVAERSVLWILQAWDFCKPSRRSGG